MAGEPIIEKRSRIVELFKNMSYETNDENLHLIKQWKNSHQPLKSLSVTDLKNLKLPSHKRIQEASERTILLQKFANLIEKSMELIGQICANETLRKEDTNSGTKLLIEYLRYYATCTMVFDEKDNTGDVLSISDAYVYPGLLGIILGPTLAHGNSAVLAVNSQLDFCSLLSELAMEAGYPSGTITVLNVKNLTNENICDWNKCETVYHFGFDDITEITKANNIGRLLNIRYGKTPMIVFDSADQQSACEVLIDAVWAYNGQLPWSVDTVFVQENIWDDFLAKFKRTINQHSLDFKNQKSKSLGIDQMISDAKTRGIEIYQGGSDSQLVVFIGQCTYETNVILDNTLVGPTLTVLPFRTINEGVALANNNRQGIAASIWGENINQVNEAARKLAVGTVWINSFCVFRPEVSFMLWKESGYGYFGGVDGLLEHHLKVELGSHQTKTEPSESAKVKLMHTAATSAQMNWLKIGRSNRSNTFMKLIAVLNKEKPKFEDWITAIYNSLTTLKISGQSNMKEFIDYDMKSIKSPIGVIAIQDISDAKGRELLFTSLLVGNVVFIVNSEDRIQSVLLEQFPKGVINVMDKISDIESIVHEANLMVFVKDYTLSRMFTQKCRQIVEKSTELYVTRTTNIWTSFGETYC